MRSVILVGILVPVLATRRREPGSGLWNLKVGGEAKPVSSDGADITL
jgi:hypothetical protein